MVDIDDLVAADMVNHAAGPQGRDGLKRILRTIDEDLGPVSFEQLHLIAEGQGGVVGPWGPWLPFPAGLDAAESHARRMAKLRAPY